MQQTAASLPSDFGFATPISGNPDPYIAGFANTLTIAASSLSGQGFQAIGLGVSDLSGTAGSAVASSVWIKPGVTLQAENIILGAKGQGGLITIDEGAQILALALPGDTGQATFIVPSGVLNVGANAVVHASNAVSLQAANVNLDPSATLKADHSDFILPGSSITIYDPSVVTPTPPGCWHRPHSGPME